MNIIGIAMQAMGILPPNYPPHSDLRAQSETSSHAANVSEPPCEPKLPTLSELIRAETRNRRQLAEALFSLLSQQPRNASWPEDGSDWAMAFAHPDWWTIDGLVLHSWLTRAYMDESGHVVLRSWADSHYGSEAGFYADREQGGETWVYKSPKNLANHLRSGPRKSLLAELVITGEIKDQSISQSADRWYEPDRRFNAVLP